MSIDTGQGLSYVANFPSPNVNQPSQQFRDNFSVIKTAIENIQAGTYSNASIFTLSSTVSTSGAFILSAGFKNNAFTLPIGTTNTTTGNIRFNSSTSKVEFYTGSSWLAMLNAEANGAVILSGSPVGLIVNNTLTVNKTPTATTDAANKIYVDNTVVAAVTPIVANIATLSTSISTVSNGLAIEANSRLAADDVLQLQINDLRDNAASSGTDTQINSLQIQIDTLGTNLTNLENRVTADENTIAVLSNTVNTDHSTLVQIGNDLAQEIIDRQTADTTINANVTSLSLYVNSVVVNGLSNSLQTEIDTRSAQSSTFSSNIINIYSNINEIWGNISSTNNRVTNTQGALLQLKNSVVHVFNTPTIPDMNALSLGDADGSLWFDSSNGNAMSIFNSNSFYDDSSNASTYWDLIDTGGAFLSTSGGTMFNDIDFSYANSNTIVMNANASVKFYDSSTGLGAYLDIANCGNVANTKILTTVNGFVDLANTTVRFPGSNVIVDADHYLLFQGIPNQVGGNDGAGIQFQSTNLDYAYLSDTYYNGIQNAIAQEITANASLTVTDARRRVAANAAHMGNSYTNWAFYTNAGVAPGPNLEFGLMKIFTTNDFENGVNNDSMALEPTASLYLNPGHQGDGQEQTSPAVRIANKTNAKVVIGNATSNVVSFTASSGDMWTKGNIFANSSAANSGSGYFTNLNVTNGTFTLSNSGFFLPQSDITIDANHALMFQSLPNQANGAGDAGYVTYDANNFDYMPEYMTPLGANTTAATYIANTVLATYGTLANADTHYEFSCLRLGTTNDPGGTTVTDSMAIEPSGDLFLNPGWQGSGTNTKSYSGTRTRLVNSVTYGGTFPFNNVDARQYSNIIVGNTTTNVMKINALTGNMWTKGNITADGDISGLSDISVKTDLERISNALDKIASISGYTFTRTDLPNNPTQMGVVAQEVEQIAPELINQLPSGLKAVAYGNMAGLFVEAFKDVKDMLVDLKAEIEEIKKKL